MFNKDHNSLIKLVEKIKHDTLIKPILSQLNVIKNGLNKFHFIEVINLGRKYQTIIYNFTLIFNYYLFTFSILN